MNTDNKNEQPEFPHYPEGIKMAMADNIRRWEALGWPARTWEQGCEWMYVFMKLRAKKEEHTPDVSDIHVGDMPTTPEQPACCQNCKVPIHRHGTACGWHNATITVDPEGIIRTPGHLLNGQNFSTAYPIGDPRKTQQVLTDKNPAEQPVGEIPEEFEEWIEKTANEMYYVGGDLPDSYIYEASAANQACKEAMIVTYRKLQPEIEALKADIRGLSEMLSQSYDGRVEMVKMDTGLRVQITALTAERDEYRELAADRLAQINQQANVLAMAQQEAKNWKEQWQNLTKPFFDEGTF